MAKKNEGVETKQRNVNEVTKAARAVVAATQALRKFDKDYAAVKAKLEKLDGRREILVEDVANARAEFDRLTATN